MSDHCHHCGGRGSLTPYSAGFLAGLQQAAYDSYRENITIAARARNDEAEAATRAVQHALDSRG